MDSEIQKERIIKQANEYRRSFLNPIINTYKEQTRICKGDDNLHLYDRGEHTIIVIVECTIKRIVIPDNIYMIIIIQSNIDMDETLHFKNCGKLTHVYLDNIKILNTTNHNFFELCYLGNIESLYINRVQNYNKFVFHKTNEEVMKYNQLRILEKKYFPIKKFENKFLIGGFETVKMFESPKLNKKIMFLDDYHTNYKLCTNTVESYTPIEFLSYIYMHRNRTLFMFERMNDKFKRECNSNPIKLPVNIIGTARWFTKLPDVVNIDNRWNEEYEDIHILTHKIISKRLNAIEKYKEFKILHELFNTYNDFIEYTINEINKMTNDNDVFIAWKYFCGNELEKLNDKYTNYYNKYVDMNENDFEIDYETNVSEMFFGPFSLLVDTNVLLNIVNNEHKYDVYIINIGGHHVDNMIKFFNMFDESLTEIFSLNNIEETKTSKSCVEFNKEYLLNFNLI